MKRCKPCGESKPLTEFAKSKRHAGGLYPYCRKCAAEKTRRWRLANPERVRALAKSRVRVERMNPAYRRAENLKKYGLTPGAFEAMRLAQNGVCAVCGCKPKAVLQVDHDHATGRVRGLLCGSCNKALGLFRDDPARLAAAVAYLRRFA